MDVSRGAARNASYLRRLGVTHVLNTAEGNERIRNGTVNTSQAYYSPYDIKYKGLKLLDVAQQNISLHFPEVAEFIDEALAGGGEGGIYGCIHGPVYGGLLWGAFMGV